MRVERTREGLVRLALDIGSTRAKKTDAKTIEQKIETATLMADSDAGG